MTPTFDPAGVAHALVLPAGLPDIDLISDLHLCDTHPRTLQAFHDFLIDPAWHALIILGDLFEAWIGDDMLHSSIEQQAGGWLAQATRSRPIWLMHGNRDFLIGDAFAAATGVTLLPDPTLLRACGQAVLLTHGDALCLADTDYQRFRAQVRSPAWQAQFLRLPIADRRAIGKNARHASETRQQDTGIKDWADVDFPQAVAWLDEAGSQVMVHGHTHRPGTNAIGPAKVRHVLTDWDLDDPLRPRAETMRLSADGLARIAIQG